jgi:hypothetical protein
MWMEELPNGKYKFFERYENELFGKTKKFSVTLTSKSSRAQKEATRMLDSLLKMWPMNGSRSICRR